jgi:hypothetical protein
MLLDITIVVQRRAKMIHYMSTDDHPDDSGGEPPRPIL